MKVLQVVPELNAGGVERTTLEVADALVSAGHEAHVASEGGRLDGELGAIGGVLHRLPVATKNPLKWTANAADLGRIIGVHGIDLVHARSRAPAFAAKAAARQASIPFVTTYHGIYNARGPFKRAYNAVMASGDVVIANSEYTRAHVIREHGTDPARIRVVPRGVDMARFDPARVGGGLRSTWGVPDAAPLWLLPGRLTEWKGQRVAVEALALSDAAHLVLVGDAQGRDAYVEGLRNLAAERGVRERLHILPHSSDMPRVLASADIVISASTDPEAFGRVATEAQAMGKPVVATAHGGSLETVEDGVTGLLVPSGDARALANACARIPSLSLNPAYARARTGRLFSDARLKSAVLEIYESLVRGTKTDALP